MANAESTRIVSAQLSIDECAVHANAYYAHQNRSTESKVFEYNFVDAQCAIFSEIECPTLCKWWYPKSLEGTKGTICHKEDGSCYEIGKLFYSKKSCKESGKILCRPKVETKGMFHI